MLGNGRICAHFVGLNAQYGQSMWNAPLSMKGLPMDAWRVSDRYE
jgi:hypothetical protein